jgi:hypothetical protein
MGPAPSTVSNSRETIVGSATPQRKSAALYSFPIYGVNDDLRERKNSYTFRPAAQSCYLLDDQKSSSRAKSPRMRSEWARQIPVRTPMISYRSHWQWIEHTSHMNVQRSLLEESLARRVEDAIRAVVAIVATPKSEYREVVVNNWSIVGRSKWSLLSGKAKTVSGRGM